MPERIAPEPLSPMRLQDMCRQT